MLLGHHSVLKQHVQSQACGLFFGFFWVFFPSPSLKYREVCLQDKRTCQGHLKMCVVIPSFYISSSCDLPQSMSLLSREH